jgi:hypothetical protein
MPETLIEAELFGHEAGAFTGATRARAGRFEEADRGTLFLDELGTLSMGAQERLLRAVEYGEVTRIGASARSVSMCASWRRPMRICPAWPGQGKFRADLLDRLSFEVITLPPLRARVGDVACWPSISPAAWPASWAGSGGPVSRRACGGDGALQLARQCARIAQCGGAGGLSLGLAGRAGGRHHLRSLREPVEAHPSMRAAEPGRG